MSENWLDLVFSKLLASQTPQGAWGYRKGTEGMVEPTALATLALLSPPRPDFVEEANRAAQAAADWLAKLQQPSGAVGLSAALPTPCWPTPLAMMVWTRWPDYQANLKLAARWLLARQGVTWENDEGDILGHNTSLVGWPWIQETSAWLEPTATALIALRAAGVDHHGRIYEAARLILDRAIPTGGWNYGNKRVFHNTLKSQPGPTGLALLALAGRDVPTATTNRAIAYLQQTLPKLRSPRSLAWGVLGLQAWGRRPAEVDSWLQGCLAVDPQLMERPTDLAFLLLGGQAAVVNMLRIPAMADEAVV